MCLWVHCSPGLCSSSVPFWPWHPRTVQYHSFHLPFLIIFPFFAHNWSHIGSSRSPSTRNCAFWCQWLLTRPAKWHHQWNSTGNILRGWVDSKSREICKIGLLPRIATPLSLQITLNDPFLNVSPNNGKQLNAKIFCKLPYQHRNGLRSQNKLNLTKQNK